MQHARHPGLSTGSYPQALDAFAWQLRLAERQEQGGADSEPALNNLALTSLKAGQPGRARAWMNLALDRGYSGKATRHNLEQVALKVDYPSLQGLAGTTCATPGRPNGKACRSNR